MQFKLKGVFRILLLCLCGTVVGINVYLANARALVGNQLPMPFGVGAAVVLSGSMEPELYKGDLIVVKETTEYAERDVVVYQEGYSLVVHRIISINGEEIITQGDANDTADHPITPKELKGKVIFHIPYLGTLVGIIKTPIGTIVVIALAIVLVEIPRRNDKRKDQEERDKILEEIAKLKEMK